LISKIPYVIISPVMKKEIHPANYRQVIFQDVTSGEMFLIGSTMKSSEKGKFEGKEYDLVKVEISSASHPFYTGKETVLDTAGRVDKFKQRALKVTKSAPKTPKAKRQKKKRKFKK
jgi:large subunit ribosomal protein L31